MQTHSWSVKDFASTRPRFDCTTRMYCESGENSMWFIVSVNVYTYIFWEVIGFFILNLGEIGFTMTFVPFVIAIRELSCE